MAEINAEIARQKRTAKEVAQTSGIEYQTSMRLRANQRVVTYPELKML